MIYKTMVLEAARKSGKMAASIEKAANKMAKKGWDLVTFSLTKSGKAILLFCLDEYLYVDDEFDDEEFAESEDEEDELECGDDEEEFEEETGAEEEADAKEEPCKVNRDAFGARIEGSAETAGEVR